jgi:hypothetical protein
MEQARIRIAEDALSLFKPHSMLRPINPIFLLTPFERKHIYILSRYLIDCKRAMDRDKRMFSRPALSISMNAVSCARWRRPADMPAFCSTKSITLMGRFTSTVCTPARSLLWTIGPSSGKPSPAKLGKTNCWDTHFGGIHEESYFLSSWAPKALRNYLSQKISQLPIRRPRE